MISSQNQRVRREQGPDILLALREWVVKDPQADAIEVHPDECASDCQDDTSSRESHHVPSSAIAELIDRKPPQASSQCEEISHDSPSIAPAEPLADLNRRRQASLQNSEIPTRGPSVARRVFRTVAHGFIIIAVIGTTIALLPSEDRSSVLRTGSSQDPDLTALLASKPLDQMRMPNEALLTAAPSVRLEPVTVTTELSAELREQLETMANDLAAVQRLMQQLAARQDQMAQEIAALQTAEQNASQKISSLSQTVSSVWIRPRRRVPRHQ